jgi:hypothetical protein
MTRVCVLPHRTTRGGVRTAPWTTLVAGAPITTDGHAEAWDHRDPLLFRSDVRIDPDHVRAECGLDDGDGLALVTTWTCLSTLTRAVGSSVAIDGARSWPVEVEIDPASVSNSVRLTRSLVLTTWASHDDPTVARRPGSILWRESPREAFTLALGPRRHRLSTDLVDFEELTDIEAGAAWQLHSDLRDLDAEPGLALRLLVNARHPAAAALGGQGDRDASTTRSVLRWDVVRRLVHAALADDDFVDSEEDHPPDTVGGTLQALFERWFPDTTPRDLRALQAAEPERLESMLQARLELLDER